MYQQPTSVQCTTSENWPAFTINLVLLKCEVDHLFTFMVRVHGHGHDCMCGGRQCLCVVNVASYPGSSPFFCMGRKSLGMRLLLMYVPGSWWGGKKKAVQYITWMVREESIMMSWGVGVWCYIIEGDPVFYDASQQTIIVVGFCMTYCPANHLYNNWWINTVMIITRRIISIAFFALCVSCPKQSSF